MATTKKEPTIEEQLKVMQEQLAALQAEQKQSTELIKEKDAEITRLKAKDAGWLITTPNPLYDEMTYGIQFVNGQAFIVEGREYPRFKKERLKEEVLEELERQAKEGEPKAMRRLDTYNREIKRPTANIAVQMLVHDMGYEAQYFGADEQENLQKILDRRAMERSEVEAKLEKVDDTFMGRPERIAA